MAPPRVSVVTINFNGAPFLASCVASMRAQTYELWEHIIVDCGSTDDSLSVLKQLRHDKLNVVETGMCGLSVARNIAVAHATGEFCAVLDADDEALPRRLAMQVNVLDDDPSLVAVGGTAITRSSGRRFSQGRFGTNAVRRYPTAHEDLVALLKCCLNPIPHSNLTFRKAAFERAGRYAEGQEKSEDFDLILRLAALGRIASIAEPVGIVRAGRSDSHTYRHQPNGNGADFFACRAVFLACVPAANRDRVSVAVEKWLAGIGQRGIAALQGKWLMGQLLRGSGKTTRASYGILVRALVSKVPSLIFSSNQRWMWSSHRPQQLLVKYIHSPSEGMNKDHD